MGGSANSGATNGAVLRRAVFIGIAAAWVLGAPLLAVIVLTKHFAAGFEGSVGETTLLVTVGVVCNILAGGIAGRIATRDGQSSALGAGALAGVGIAATTILFGVLTRHVFEVAPFHTSLSDLSGAPSGAVLGLAGAAIFLARRPRAAGEAATH
jgi:hypothetical protein